MLLELARRLETRPHEPRLQICTPADVAAIYGPQMRDLKQEVFRVLYLNTANIVIGVEPCVQ